MVAGGLWWFLLICFCRCFVGGSGFCTAGLLSGCGCRGNWLFDHCGVVCGGVCCLV